MIRNRKFKGDEENLSAFVYGFDTNVDGDVYIGDGTDENPCYIAFSSKALVLQMKKALNTPHVPLVLHVDSTYKLNVNEFPVFVIGMTDMQKQFHLLALAIISHKTVDSYVRVLSDFRDMTHTILNHFAGPFNPDYIMLDAETNERTACLQVFGIQSHQLIMCYFHVQKNVKEHLKHIFKQVQGGSAKC